MSPNRACSIEITHVPLSLSVKKTTITQHLNYFGDFYSTFHQLTDKTADVFQLNG